MLYVREREREEGSSSSRGVVGVVGVCVCVWEIRTYIYDANVIHAGTRSSDRR